MARKSRKETVITAEPVPSLYVHVALYIRLSVEDNKKRGCSVENQKLVLNDFLADKPDFVVYDTYIDNGMTGTNFHRPGFQQMLSDIEAGYINCVIVKDLSRLGRNSIDTGYYIEQYFYTHNVRFIAVTDQFDTADPGNLHGGIMLPLKNMINEAYSLDIGRKIKAQARQAMKDGDYIGARAPYGYRKDPENCHKLLIDEAAAPVVQQIFQWAYERVALNRIVRNLNEMGIPAPSHYKKTTGEITSPGLIGSGKWQTRTVMKILESEVYTGDLVQGKTKIVDHQQVQAGDDNLIVARHTHEPIISHLLRGKVFCGCCDHAMSLRNGAWFYCRHSEVSESFPCHGVRVKMADLEQVVFETIRAQMCPALGIDGSKDKLDLQTVQQAEHEDKLRAIQDSKRQLYERYALGEIDLETYRSQKAVYDAELVQAKNVHAAITAQTKQIQSDYEARLKQREIVQEVGSTDVLTQSLIDRLINRVYVFPGDRIEIEYVTQDFLGTEKSGKEA